MDADRPYDNQALEALRRARAAKKAQYDSAVRNITDRRAAQGIAPNEEALDETLRQMGYVELKRKIDVLEKAVVRFVKEVGDQPERSMRPRLDPKRTVFVLDPPREFPSIAAMEFFLDQNPEIRAKHDAYLAQADGSIRASTSPIPSIQQFIKEAANDVEVS